VLEKSVEKKTHFKLRLLVVDPGVRGRGTGSKLLEASQQFAMSRILSRQDRCVIVLDVFVKWATKDIMQGESLKP
jgi:GNAT superfamily N-acetyltransferase